MDVLGDINSDVQMYTKADIDASGFTLNQPVINGVTNGSSAASGVVGEIIFGGVVRSSATSLTTNTPKTVVSITLTNGDWDISGAFGFLFGTGTSLTNLRGSISLTTNAISGSDTTAYPTAGEILMAPLSLSAGQVQATGVATAYTIPKYRVSISGGSVTFYLVVRAVFTVSTCDGFGFIEARRVR